MMKKTALIVMAKAPQPGLAKTRLIPALGPEGAAALAHQLLDHAMHQACCSSARPVQLCVWPDEAHPAFAAWLKRPEVKLVRQVQGDLGQRMSTAFRQALSTADISAALIMGTDAPALDSELIDSALKGLEQHDAVIVPAADGGYALLGLRRHEASLFEQMPWSTGQVLALTRQRLRQAGMSVLELETVHDIDEPADLSHLAPPFTTGAN